MLSGGDALGPSPSIGTMRVDGNFGFPPPLPPEVHSLGAHRLRPLHGSVVRHTHRKEPSFPLPHHVEAAEAESQGQRILPTGVDSWKHTFWAPQAKWIAERVLSCKNAGRRSAEEVALLESLRKAWADLNKPTFLADVPKLGAVAYPRVRIGCLVWDDAPGPLV